MQPIFIPSPVHILAVAPAGAGKSTALAIPNAFAWPKSLFCLDIKAEIYSTVARWRAKHLGRRQVRLDPLQVLGRGGDTLNVLSNLNPRSPHFLPDVRALAEALVIKQPQEREPHWTQSSEIWIAALIADNVQHFSPTHRNLQTVRSIMTNGEYLADAISRLVLSDDEFLARAGGMLLNYTEREMFSVQTSLNREMSFLDNPLIYQFTQKSSFDLRTFLDGNTDIYFILPPQYLRSESRLVRLVLTSIFRTVLAAGIDRHREILFLLDEAPALGRLEILLDAITQFRGFGVKICLIVQSAAQLQTMFPENQYEVVLANTDQIYLGIRDYATAEIVSKRLGNATVQSNSGQQSGGLTWSQGQGYSLGGNSGWSQGVGEVGKPLLMPDEVIRLGNRRAVVFVQNLPPLLVQICPYYDDPVFLDREEPALTGKEVFRCLFWLGCAVILAIAAGSWRHEAESRQIHYPPTYPPRPMVWPVPPQP